MVDVQLSAEEKLILKARHRKSRDSLECDRIKAVIWYSEGWTIEQIAKALFLDNTTIRRHIHDYTQSQRLKPGNGGSEGYLNEAQTAELIAHLDTTLYQHQYQIVQFIEKRWGVQFSVSGLNKWLKRHHFVYKQPSSRPYQADLEKQEAFIKEYQKLKADLPEDEEIVFMDSAHPTQATKFSHGWIRKGKRKFLNTNASRTRLNMVGAINLDKLETQLINRFDCNIDSDVICAFLPQIRRQYSDKGTIHLIMDQAGYHKANSVQEMAKALNIKIHFLPPHSPNLNPIERFWKLMNQRARNNIFFHSAKEFREKIDEFFKDTVPKIKKEMASLINDNFQRLENAA